MSTPASPTDMQQQRRGMIPEDLYRIAWVEDARISPDGRRVAVVRKQMDAGQDEYLSQIWVVEFDGGEPRRFTAGPRADTCPRWSANGAWLAFLSNRESSSSPKKAADTAKGPNRSGSQKQIWLLPSTGGEARRLTNQTEGVSGFVWAPDGRSVAFVSRVPSAPERPDDSTQPARIFSTLRYRSNGEGFTYDRRMHIFVQAVDEPEPHQLTDGDHDDDEPCWSPDGAIIAFTSTGHQTEGLGMVSDIFLVPADGGQSRRLTAGTGTTQTPAFSPDGSQIAYYGHEDPYPGGSRNLVLYLMRADGNQSRPLTQSLDRSAIADVPPIWAADGARILIGVLDSGAAGLYAVDPATRDIVPVCAGRRLLSSWSASLDASRIAFTASTPAEPPEAFGCGWDAPEATATEHRLSHFNAAWVAEVHLSQPEHFRFRARDRLELEGWAMRPSGAQGFSDAGAESRDQRTAAPVLLNVHGGPHAFYGWGFFDEFQVQAGAGYGVVYINPRGSQGYGESFARACCGDWGGADYEDLMRGLDEALVRFDSLDRERVGVLGGSYGGFMTSWIVGHTDRFRAAVSERAVNAPISLFGTSDIGYWFEQYEVGGDPLANRDGYLLHSPLSYAQQISTPLLIMHSENDLRCPIEQAEQLYILLKLQRRADTVFVRFPEENHELTRSGKPSRRVERFQILLDWFDRYLHGDGQVNPVTVRSPGLLEALRGGGLMEPTTT